MCPRWASFCGDTAAHLLAISIKSGTQERGRNRIPDYGFVRNSVVLSTTLVVHVGRDLRACSVARRRDLRRGGTTPLHTCPWRGGPFGVHGCYWGGGGGPLPLSSAVALPGPCGRRGGGFRAPICLCVLAVALLTAPSAAVRLLFLSLLLFLSVRLPFAGLCLCALLLTINCKPSRSSGGTY